MEADVNKMRRSVTLTLADASAETGIAIGTLREYVKKGLIKATKPGKLVLIYSESLLKFLKQNEIAS